MRRYLTILTLSIGLLAMSACTLASEPIPAGPIESGPLPGEEIAPPEEGASADAVAETVPVQMPRAAQGELLYFENCVRCHGVNGTGDGEFTEQLIEQGAELPDFTDPALVRSRTPQDWYLIITNGNMMAFMPPWGGSMTDSQRWDATYFLYRLSVGDEVLEQGEALYDEYFAAEYGQDGEAIGLNQPAAVAEISQQTIYDDYVASSGVELTEDEGWAVAAYMQTFGYDAALSGAIVEEAAPAEEETAEQSADASAEDRPAEEASVEEQPAEETAVSGVGDVYGTVTLGGGGDLPAGLEVQLTGLTVDMTDNVTEFLSVTQPVNEDGTYRFEDMALDVERAAYVVEVMYDGVAFSNGRIIEPGLTEMDIPLTVYENTTDSSVITVDAMHIILQEHPDALLVTQLVVYSNNSDRIYVTDQAVAGGRRGSVAISIPPDAYSITFEDGELGGRFMPSGDLYYDTEKVLPGSRSHSVIVNYFLPTDGGQRDVELPLLYDTTQVTVLIPEGPTLKSDVLNEAGSTSIQSQTYSQYTASSLGQGDTLTFRVAPASNLGRLLPIAGLAVAGALLGVGGIWWYTRRDRSAGPRRVPGLNAQEEALVREIADLDTAYEAGRINRFEWETRRADLKATLAEAMEGT